MDVHTYSTDNYAALICLNLWFICYHNHFYIYTTAIVISNYRPLDLTQDTKPLEQVYATIIQATMRYIYFHWPKIFTANVSAVIRDD